MKRISFTKMVGAGNDFIVIDSKPMDYVKLARVLCERKTAVGADGLLVLEKSKKADFKMRIFNADGSEAETCGNGLRCAALYTVHKNRSASFDGVYPEQSRGAQDRQMRKLRMETTAGIYEADITGKNRVRIKMEGPRHIKLNLPIIVSGRRIKVNYVDTGVPHAVVFVQGLEKIDVESIGRDVRNNQRFKPAGTNVDFVEISDYKNIKMRTYERGVEAETLACGTGAVASAILTAHPSTSLGTGESRVIPRLRSGQANHEINIHTKGGILKVYFKKIGSKIKDVYLEGEAKEVYRGEVPYV